MSKMGISHAAELSRRADLRGIGLEQGFVDATSRGPPRASAASASTSIAEEVLQRHAAAFPVARRRRAGPRAGGEYQWRRDGEYHLFNPDTVFKLQHATRSGQYKIYKEYTKLVNDQSRQLATLRGLLELQAGRHAGADRRGRAGRGDRQALRDRRDVVRLDQPGGARDPGDRDEPARRQVEHGRGRRGSGALHAGRRTATGAAARSSRWRRRASA